MPARTTSMPMSYFGERYACAHSHLTSSTLSVPDAQYAAIDALEQMVVATDPLYASDFTPNAGQAFALGEFNQKAIDDFFTPYPDYFLPYAQVPYYRMVSDVAEWAAAAVVGAMFWAFELWVLEEELDGLLGEVLSTGPTFRGVGEVLVHGHGLDSNGSLQSDGTASAISLYPRRDPANLVAIGRAAARHDVPLLVHWEIAGMGDDHGSVSEDTSYGQLLDLLTYFAEGVETEDSSGGTSKHGLKLVLGHCATGPTVNNLSDTDCAVTDVREDAPVFGGRILYLMETFETLYFDIAALETDEDDKAGHLYKVGDPTDRRPLGTLVLDLIDRFPTRVLFGLDSSACYDVGPNDWNADNIRTRTRRYADFLSENGVDSTTIQLVMRDNLSTLLADAPRVP